MKFNLSILALTGLAICASLACSKKNNVQPEETVLTQQTTVNAKANSTGYANGDTMLLINYETGTLNSGIAKLNTTNATATDASYLVSPGRTGTYAIAHKVTIGDNGYFSDNHWRSESATAYVPEGKHERGDERRYEVSLLLKDWTRYTTGMSEAGDIIFQGKLGGGGNPAFYLMTKRNAIAFRAPNNNYQKTVIADFRNYINQWIDFRIDVLWQDGPTGYYKVSYRLPGQTDYTLVVNETNFHTFLPDNPAATSGYLKWGLYRPGQSLANNDVPTRIIYHDDIRVIKLPLP